MGWKGRRFWRSRLWVNFPLIALFSAFRKENQRLVSTSPLHLMPPILETNAKEMLNTLSFNEKEEGLGEGLWRTSYVKLFSETDSEFPQSNPCCTKREFCRAHKNQKKAMVFSEITLRQGLGVRKTWETSSTLLTTPSEALKQWEVSLRLGKRVFKKADCFVLRAE